MEAPLNLRQDDLWIRPLTQADAPILLRWLQDPRNLHWWEGESAVFTEARIQEDFYTEEPFLRRCMIEAEGKVIGYVQVQRLDDELCAEYKYPHPELLCFGIDQFIGEPDFRSRGIGRRFLRLLLEHLERDEGAQAVILDPHADNLRAIRCYEACGFQKIKFLPAHELHDGKMVDCWLMCRVPLQASESLRWQT